VKVQNVLLTSCHVRINGNPIIYFREKDMYFNEDVSDRMNFDLVSSSYFEARPEYPIEMYNDIAEIVGVKDTPLIFSHVLEVGSGSGQATQTLSKFSDFVDCVEPGENFVNILNSIFEKNSNVTIHRSTFEDFSTTKKYDLVFSGSALHWIEKDVVFEKSRDLLNDNGWLMAVWHMPRFSDEVYVLVDKFIMPYIPGFDIPRGTPKQIEYFDQGLKDFSDNRGFKKCSRKIYYNKKNLSNDKLTDLIWSYASVTKIGESNSESVYQSLRQGIINIGKESHEVNNCFPFVAGQRIGVYRL